MEKDTGPAALEARQALKTPRAAAIAGIIFSLLVGFCFVMFRIALPATISEAELRLSNPALNSMVYVALTLIPFAGIAFLWFMGVVRDRMGQHEDRFFATVFLGSGLLFIAMLFAAVAIATGLLAVQWPTADLWRFGHGVMEVLVTYSVKMAAVFMIATATISLRTAIMSNWLGWAGYVIAVALLLAAGIVPWIELLFPVWVFLVSVYVLHASFHKSAEELPIGSAAVRVGDEVLG